MRIYSHIKFLSVVLVFALLVQPAVPQGDIAVFAQNTLAPFSSSMPVLVADAVAVDISFQGELNSHSDAKLGEHFIISYFPDGEFKLTLKDQRLVRGMNIALRTKLTSRQDLVKIFLALGTLKDAGAKNISLLIDLTAPVADEKLSQMIETEDCFGAIVSLFADLGAEECLVKRSDRDWTMMPSPERLKRKRFPDPSRSRVADVDAFVYFSKDNEFAKGILPSLNSGVNVLDIDSITEFFESNPALPADVLIAARPQKAEDVIDLLLLSRTLALRGCRVKIYSGAIAMARQHKSWTPKFHTYMDPALGLDSPEVALESASIKYILENIGCRWLIGHNLHFVKAGMVEVYNVSSSTALPGIIDINAFPDLLADTVSRIRKKYPERKVYVFGADKGVAADMADAEQTLLSLGVVKVGFLNKHRISSTQVSYDGNIYGVDGTFITPAELKGAVIIIADDEISSGGTIAGGAAMIDELAGGDISIYMSVVLGRFSGNCWERIRNVKSVEGVFISDLYATKPAEPTVTDSGLAKPVKWDDYKKGDGGLLSTVVFAGRFMDNMLLFAGMQRRAIRWAAGSLDDGREFSAKYPYILKAFVYSILNKRFLRKADMNTLRGLIKLIDRMPESAEIMTLAALIDLKMKFSQQVKDDKFAFKKIRSLYSEQGQKQERIAELVFDVYSLLVTEYPEMEFSNSDILSVTETVISIMKENELNTFEAAASYVVNDKLIQNPHMDTEKAVIIAEQVLWGLFAVGKKSRYSYLFEVHGDEAYSEDMAEVMKVRNDHEFARVLFLNISRMLHLRYSVVFSERLRFMLSSALKIIDPEFEGLGMPQSSEIEQRTIRDILISVFAGTNGRFRRLKRAHFLESSA